VTTPDGSVLVLAYHAIDAEWRSPMSVSEHIFRHQIEYLAERGYRGVTCADIEARRLRRASDRLVAVTFDDAFKSVRRAVRVLHDVGWAATVFVPTWFPDNDADIEWYGCDNDAGVPPNARCGMRWNDLRALAAAGWEVGSHGVHHRASTALSDQDLADEFGRSRRRVADEIGRCTSLAYPYGVADDRVARAAQRAGYERAFTMRWSHVVDTAMQRPRIRMDESYRSLRLRLALSPAASALRHSRALEIGLRNTRRRSWLPPA
jgi:peptidoglycan/xylan/chitin deacetylase (PgdA/CDA1 family)